MLDGDPAFAFAAAHTSRIRPGTLCTGVTHRHPGLLERPVASLDVLSGGRAHLGIVPNTSSASRRSVVDDGHERVVAVGLPPGPRGILLVGTGQHAVDVRHHLTVGLRSAGLGQLPDAVADFGPGGADRGRCPRAHLGESVDQAGDGRAGGHRREDGRFGPQHRDIGRAVLPKAVESARSGRILPGSCTARSLRHGASAADDAASVHSCEPSPATGPPRPARPPHDRCPDSDRRVRPATPPHRGASLPVPNGTFDKPCRPGSEAFLAHLITFGRPSSWKSEASPWCRDAGSRRSRPGPAASAGIRRRGPRTHGSDHWRAGCLENGPVGFGRGRQNRAPARGASSAAYFACSGGDWKRSRS